MIPSTRAPSANARRTAAHGFLVTFIALLAACAQTGPRPADETSPSATRPAGMPENINAPFLAQDMAIDEWVERFEGESRAVFARRAEIVEAMGLAPGVGVADIGAGTGFFTALFDAEVGDAGDVFAVEISPGFLAHLRERVAREGLGSVQVVEGSDRSVELPPASIDVAFVCDVYHHFEYPEATLASIRHALRPGGVLVLIDFERIPGVTSEYLLQHVRAGREVFSDEIIRSGFRLRDEIELDGLEDNYILRFVRTGD